MMGRIFGRWLLSSIALGAIGGGLYGILIASTLGSPDEAAIVSDAPVAIVLGIGLGIGSMLGVIAGTAIGIALGLAMATLNERAGGLPEGQYLRRIRIIAIAAPLLSGLALLTWLGRLATFDLVPVLLAGVVWGVAAKRIAESYRPSWPHSQSKLTR